MTARRPLKVLIVDDESLARQRLHDLLSREKNIEIAGQADNGEAAVAAINTLAPDLVFLDVQMPGKTGVEVARAVGLQRMPATIFVTAYDHYALKAFEVAAIDYLVKPFDDERFEQAFRRARRMIELEEVHRLSEDLLAVLQGKQDAGNQAPSAQYLERIPVESRGQVRVVAVDEIEYISASGPYAELHVGDKTYVIRERMQSLEEQLDPSRFFRIHRSSIVRLDRVDTLLRDPGGDYAVRLKSGARLDVSRNRVEQLEKWMGLPGSRS
ncbi:MAG TPA: LytTR family DNA-binding domain-containing protein [Steroidobacteraceae bacterium]|nr:LytTR family DNA-binding domain-containing protein [Steroidobacteraceae bacterium]